jgi:DNA-binding winged helix-turn-helix (wHTH) protein
MRYGFGEFLYDPLNRTLSRGEEEIALTPKTRDLLALFLENPKRLLTRQTISDRLWPDVAVTDDALRFQVAELRKAMGNESEGFLRTIPREGYRWEVEVRREEKAGARAAPGNTERCYRLFLESREVSLEEGENLIGRDSDTAVWIDHTSVSRHHARICVTGERVTLEDLESKNGTYLRGERIGHPLSLSDGDTIRIGRVSMTFRVLSRVVSTETEEERRGRS